MASTSDTQDPGSAYVFSSSPDGWVQRLRLAPTADAPPNSFGVSLATATERAVVGDYGTSTKPGAVYIYDLSRQPTPPELDILGPTIESIVSSPAQITEQGRRFVLVRLDVRASDPSGPVTWSITHVDSSDPAGRRQAPEWLVGRNRHSVRLRASTSTPNTDRLYTIHIEARDRLGNVTKSQKTVRIVAKPRRTLRIDPPVAMR